MINFMGGFSKAKQDEQPQQNQFMGDTPSKPDNNTSWMAPASDQSNTADTGAQAPQVQPWKGVGGGSSDGTALSSAVNGVWHNPASSTGNTGINGGASWQGGGGGGWSMPGNDDWKQHQYQGSQEQQQQGGPPAAPSGRVGQYMPEGYDTTKFSDTANANSIKYQVGRILSQYPPGPEGLQQAAGELSRLGISVQGRDKIRLPDGTTTDVGKSFSDPNAQHAWQYNWSGLGGDGGGQQMGNQMALGQSMLGQQQQGNFQGGMDPNQIMQLIQQLTGQGGMKTKQMPFNFGSSQMASPDGGGIAQSQGSMLGGPSNQLQNHYNQGTAQGQDMSWMQQQGLPVSSMGIRAPGPDNPFANNPNVRF